MRDPAPGKRLNQSIVQSQVVQSYWGYRQPAHGQPGIAGSVKPAGTGADGAVGIG